ncbi:MAG: tRNA (adenosine(37)-N6)-dimethylallyltransferase MiaA [Bacteroidetes bacterium]|nr:tRNA (adenosine(37)-N6)-dimethylallyltransferase MiaA [Bacteroidota bacterium]
MESKVIVIAGPTCSGKTSLAILLAEKLHSEIISADSRQIFRHLDIGTAKPSAEQLRKVKHHFIDVLEPEENYNVSKFENDALKIIKDLSSRKKIPIVAGGSGLYIKALVDGIFDTVDTDEDFRNDLLEKRKLNGNEFIYNELKKVDPVSAAKMLPQNWKRVMRALEVFHLTGKQISVHHQEQKRNTDIKFLQYGLRWQRAVLYNNIEKRVDEMIEHGLVYETKSLIDRYDRKLNSLNTVGYKEIISYLKGDISLDRATELIKRNTRRFAKRQLTWFRADDRIIWFDIKSQKDLEIIAEEIIRREDLQ